MLDIDIRPTPIRVPTLRQTAGLSALFCVLCGVHLSLFRVTAAAAGYASAGFVVGVVYAGCAHFVTVRAPGSVPGVSWQEMSAMRRFFLFVLFTTIFQLLLDISGIPGWIITSTLVGSTLPYIVGSWLLLAGGDSERLPPDS